MPFLGEIPQANGYSVDFTDMQSRAALTIFNIRRDRISEVENLVLVPNAQTQDATTGPRTLGSNVGRIVIVVNLLNGSATMTINGTQVSVAPDTTVTFDVV